MLKKDFVCDVKAEEIEQFRLKAEENDLSINIIETLPELFINPYADKYKLFKNLNCNTEEKDIEEVLKSFKV
jgi:hypothetical protein